MTRSEALKKIRDYNNCLDPYDDREFEEQILSFIEDVIGMLPPPKELIPTTCNILYYYTKHEYGKGEKYIQLWEEE